MQQSPQDTLIESNHIVLPSHTNALGTMFGGTMLSWIDIAAAICAQRYSGRVAVTASIDAAYFLAPARIGDIVTVKARVVHTGKSSMVITADAYAFDGKTKETRKCITAHFGFVALDNNNKPTAVPPIAPNTKEEKEEFNAAALRRESLLKGRPAKS